MKNKKGFTLIELLAVIVILAVIALIATPLIMNVINDAKKGAARDAGYSVIKAGELKVATSGIENMNPPYHYDETSNLDMKGTKPTKFTLDINENMETQLKAWINGYCVVKEYGNETVTIDESKKSESDCVTGGSSMIKKYENGTAIYFNPETNQKCSDYTEANSLNETKSGCMKWYAFNDTEDSSTVNVILDHNTTYNVMTFDIGWQEVPKALETDTSTWNKSLNARLIEANEIAKITENTGFDATVEGKDNWFYLENNTQNVPTLSQGQAKYKWLFDYTSGYSGDCTKYGCSIADSDAFGYWTSTPNASPSYRNTTWHVDCAGDLSDGNVDDSGRGVRPVITISKSILS